MVLPRLLLNKWSTNEISAPVILQIHSFIPVTACVDVNISVIVVNFNQSRRWAKLINFKARLGKHNTEGVPFGHTPTHPVNCNKLNSAGL